MRTARVALNCADQLGEGHWWCFREHVLWRVDIHGCTLHRWNPETGEQQSFKFGEPIGCFVPCTDGRPEGLSELDLRGDAEAVLAAADERGRRSGDSQVTICGVRLNLV